MASRQWRELPCVSPQDLKAPSIFLEKSASPFGAIRLWYLINSLHVNGHLLIPVCPLSHTAMQQQGHRVFIHFPFHPFILGSEWLGQPSAVISWEKSQYGTTYCTELNDSVRISWVALMSVKQYSRWDEKACVLDYCWDVSKDQLWDFSLVSQRNYSKAFQVFRHYDSRLSMFRTDFWLYLHRIESHLLINCFIRSYHA